MHPTTLNLMLIVQMRFNNVNIDIFNKNTTRKFKLINPDISNVTTNSAWNIPKVHLKFIRKMEHTISVS